MTIPLWQLNNKDAYVIISSMFLFRPCQVSVSISFVFRIHRQHKDEFFNWRLIVRSTHPTHYTLHADVIMCCLLWISSSKLILRFNVSIYQTKIVTTWKQRDYWTSYINTSSIDSSRHARIKPVNVHTKPAVYLCVGVAVSSRMRRLCVTELFTLELLFIMCTVTTITAQIDIAKCRINCLLKVSDAHYHLELVVIFIFCPCWNR